MPFIYFQMFGAINTDMNDNFVILYNFVYNIYTCKSVFTRNTCTRNSQQERKFQRCFISSASL